MEVVFQIQIHKKDLELLKLIQAFFGGIGVISTSPNDMCAFKVTSIKQILNQIIPHFDKYKLITQKQADYLLFKQAVDFLNLKARSNIEGILKIISIKASMNLGLSDSLRVNFPNILPVPSPPRSLFFRYPTS